MSTRLIELADEAATTQLGAQLATGLPDTATIYLEGPLGAGKTTLVRGLLRALGHSGRVRSPSYSLLESYGLGSRTLLHLDLYRISDPAELEALGLREMLDVGTILLAEWPDRGGTALPPSDLRVQLDYAGETRRAALDPTSPTGQRILLALLDPD